MADREKRGEDENTKIWISQERKELFRWNKKHFSWVLKGYNLVKNKNLKKNSGHKLWKANENEQGDGGESKSICKLAPRKKLPNFPNNNLCWVYKNINSFLSFHFSLHQFFIRKFISIAELFWERRETH